MSSDLSSVLSEVLLEYPDLSQDLSHDMNYLVEDDFVAALAEAIRDGEIPLAQLRGWHGLDLENLIRSSGVVNLSDHLFQALLMAAPAVLLHEWIDGDPDVLRQGTWAINRVLANPSASSHLLMRCLDVLLAQGDLNEEWLERVAAHPAADDELCAKVWQAAERLGLDL